MNSRRDSLTRLEQRLGRLFVTGLAVSAFVLAAGLVAYLIAPETRVPLFLLEAGLVVLMATPLLRVIVSIVEYVHLRDWLFVVITLVVLAELSATMLYAYLQG